MNIIKGTAAYLDFSSLGQVAVLCSAMTRERGTPNGDAWQ